MPRNNKNAGPWPRTDAGEILSKALRHAATDIKFRDRCLASAVSAKKAVQEVAGNQTIPDDVEIRFMPLEELHRIFILEVPEFVGGSPDDVGNVEKYIRCTWPVYRSAELAAQARKKKSNKRR